MIWIATLCLLFLAAWLFLNALNERRWVQANSHDESVASDDGLFAGTVSRVQEKTSQYGERFFESSAAAARLGDDEPRPQSAKEENSFFGRAVARIGESVDRMDSKLDQKIKAASSETNFASNGGAEEGVVARASRKVATSSEVMSLRVANYARGLGRNASGDNGVFGKMTGKVSNSMKQTRSSSADGEDLVTRLSSKVGKSMSQLDEKMASAGNRINDLDEKIVTASKNAADKLDK